jgi:hypothetical protein
LKKLIGSLLALTTALALGCDERTPTSLTEDFLPVLPTTFEVRLSWEQFATGLEVYGGFGLPSDRGGGVLANAFRGLLHARTLGRFERLDPLVQVPDSTGTLVEDPNPRLRGGRVIVHFDSLGSHPGRPVTISVLRMSTEFDAITATWELAADSVGARRPWPQVGGGPAVQVGQAVWDAAQGDSVVIPVDSATVKTWTDTLPSLRAFRLDVETTDVHFDVEGVQLQYDITPSIKRDTTVVRTAATTALTFIYTPRPAAPTRGIRVGGAPAWRSVIRTQIPKVLTGPPDLCAVLGCPFELDAERINHASLVLTTRPSDPPAFQPQDSVIVDVRAVLAPERLPKAPLGPSLAGLGGRALAPALFGSPQQVTVPITGFVRAQVTEDSTAVVPPPRALALLALPEPAGISFASFAGPGEAGSPFLRLIITNAPPVQLP